MFSSDTSFTSASRQVGFPTTSDQDVREASAHGMMSINSASGLLHFRRGELGLKVRDLSSQLRLSGDPSPPGATQRLPITTKYAALTQEIPRELGALC